MENTMSVKEYLRQARTLQIKVKGTCERIRELREISENTTVLPKHDLVKGGINDDRMCHVIACMIDLQSELTVDAEKSVQLQQEIQGNISGIRNVKYRTLLELYYLNCYTWEKVAECMCISDRHAKRLHGDALKELEEILKCPVMSPP